MTKRMLIDATHEEETRVAVVDGNKLTNFDYESQVRKQLKGSIFLAKVTRVEPSLQAAFVNFGGNRHGFLPFSEIHPDYFRIPISDREALLAEQQAEMEARLAEEEAEEEALAAAEAADENDGNYDENSDPDEDNDNDEDNDDLDDEADTSADKDDQKKEVAKKTTKKTSKKDDKQPSDAKPNKAETKEAETKEEEKEASTNASTDTSNEQTSKEDQEADKPRGRGRGGRGRGGRGRNYSGRGRGRNMAASSRRVEIVGGDGVEGDRPIRPSLRRNYKIQEVVKRGQIMLIQVSREERGNKGAAVTTYMSLPGRYGVLMPNSPRGGGVSRKIANYKDRKRLREILSELKVPTGMSVIMRTAGVSRTKTEIKRDIDYLMRLWDSIRELTLKSTAPAAIHEESSLIRRSIRDIYSRDIEEIQVSGEEGFKSARDFMKMMVPSHVKKVKEYKDEQIPLFHRYQVESQINEIGNTNATLPSGGYLVINPTEALVSIDVNSGRATRERHIEETALRTNMEAAEEVARQLRLRDLGGLVVIDFIDMEDRRNNRKVENKMKEALSTDRARIQIGRISSFGLMELSRQRLNPSLTEAQYEQCPHCQGAGNVRSIDSATIIALRALEEEGIRSRSGEVVLKIPNAIAIYILNQKRDMLADIERRYGFNVQIDVDETLAPAGFKIEAIKGGETAPKTETDDSNQSDSDEKNQRSSSGGRRRGRRGGRNRNVPSRDRQGEDSSNTDNNTGEKSNADKKDIVAETPQEDKPKRGRGRSTKKEENKDVPEVKTEAKLKPAQKETTKKSEEKKPVDDKPVDDKKVEKKKTPVKKAEKAKASNDTTPVKKDYEVVNETPTEKKKGWWSKK